jgi:hypothetical protein
VIAPVLQTLSGLERLNIANCESLSQLSVVFEALTHCPSLHTLDISHFCRFAKSYRGLQQLTGLTELRARAAVDQFSITALALLSSLRVLDLSYNSVVDDRTLVALTALSSLTELNLSHNEYMTAQSVNAVLLSNT